MSEDDPGYTLVVTSESPEDDTAIVRVGEKVAEGRFRGELNESERTMYDQVHDALKKGHDVLLERTDTSGIHIHPATGMTSVTLLPKDTELAQEEDDRATPLTRHSVQ